MHIITLISIFTLITLITLIKLNILLKLLYLMYVPFHLATVVDDDDGQRGHDEEHLPSQGGAARTRGCSAYTAICFLLNCSMAVTDWTSS